MMVVQTSTSASPLAKSIITSSSSDSAIWPWPIMMRAEGTSLRISSAVWWMVRTRLWR